MILYNTLIGVLVGIASILTARSLYMLDRGRKVPMISTGITYLVVGIPLTFLAAMMTVTWPLTANPPINIAFGEPALMVGVISTAAGILLVKNTEKTLNLEFRPFNYVVAALGAILAAISLAIFNFNLVGDAPAQEPITGSATGWENTTFGIVYAVAAIACLSMGVIRTFSGLAIKISYVSYALAGAFFLGFSVLNYYTHIGLLINLQG